MNLSFVRKKFCEKEEFGNEKLHFFFSPKTNIDTFLVKLWWILFWIFVDGCVRELLHIFILFIKNYWNDVWFQKFLTDLSASSKRIEALDAAVEEFVRQGHSQLDKVRARQKQIHQLWDHLNWLKAQKERSLEGASRWVVTFGMFLKQIYNFPY